MWLRYCEFLCFVVVEHLRVESHHLDQRKQVAEPVSENLDPGVPERNNNPPVGKQRRANDGTDHF